MRTKIKAILFDIDDTLFDRIKSQHLVLDKIVTKLPHVFYSLENGRIMEAFLESDRISTLDWEAGRHVDDVREYRSNIFLKELGLSTDHAGIITDIYVQEYPFINAPVEGAVELVEKASLRFKTGVISNSMPDVQYQKIKTLGLQSYFSCVVLATEIGLKKPDARIFIHAAKQLQLQPDECMYIGDNYENDIAGGKGAGMKTCWFRRGNNADMDSTQHADFIVESLEEAGRIIENL
jgi:putative hydrolase of the HAD superfamily